MTVTSVPSTVSKGRYPKVWGYEFGHRLRTTDYTGPDSSPRTSTSHCAIDINRVGPKYVKEAQGSQCWSIVTQHTYSDPTTDCRNQGKSTTASLSQTSGEPLW